MEMHLVYHTGERRFTCEVCGQSFFAINALKRHTKLHTGMEILYINFIINVLSCDSKGLNANSLAWYLNIFNEGSPCSTIVYIKLADVLLAN